MNFFKLALWLAMASIIFLVLIIFSPTKYIVLRWENFIFSPGVLFPFLLFSRISAHASLVLNFIYAERLFIIHEVAVSKRKKYFPSMLCIPAIFSFFWFCIKFYQGFTVH